ncbi:MAG: metal-dependent hydrolase [Halobacteriales archaeon]
MASTLVHVAVAGLLAAALLGESFDRESVLFVLAATAAIDLDAFVGVYLQGAHRAAFHTVLLPTVLGVLAYYDLRRESSLLLGWRADAGRVVAVGLLAVAAAGIGLDMVINGVNVFYPVHDQFYTVDGKLLVSDRRGVVQTFVDLQPKTPTDGTQPSPKTTNNTHYSTGVDPTGGSEQTDVERKFWVVGSGERLLLTVVGYGALAARFVESRSSR